ncbi:peptidylprolyl isomerase [Sphingomonas sp. AP4-R1]|nr:peptidylprolyl isomerase [Sphingomonas sp. AP4-R1]
MMAMLMAGATPLVMSAVQAQAQDQADVPDNDPLNLPENIALLGHNDPSVRKATAIVNGTIITDTDVDQRLGLVLAASPQTISTEERQRLRLQVLSNLIDEALEIQEAAANKITIDKAEIEQTYRRVGGQFKKSPADFGVFLKEKGSSEASMKRQIEGEVAWRRLLGRQVEPFVSVSDEEVKQVIDRLKNSKGAAEYHVGEIYLQAPIGTEAQVRANADRIVQQIRQGGSFVAYAHEYSEASTKAVGGDLGWVRAEQLPDSLAAAVEQMPTSSVSDPIGVPGGISIIALIDKRQVLTVDPRDTVLALKQVSIHVDPNASKEQAQPKVTAFGDALKQLKGCGDVAALAAKVGGEVIDNDNLRVRELPPQLQEVMLNLRVGEATPPFGSSQDGIIRALVVCGRDEPQDATLPTFEQVQSQMEEQRVNLRARRYLRDLRRDAVIDYR